MNKILLGAVVSLLWATLAWGQANVGPEDVRQAAQAGDADAQLEMGILYEFGFNMEGNTVPALAWYMLSAKQGNQKAIQRRDLLMSRMSQTEIEQAQQESTRLLQTPTTQ